MVIMTNMIMIHGMVASFAKVGGAYGEELFSQKEKVKRGGAPFHHVVNTEFHHGVMRCTNSPYSSS